jgi:hypothetical protein
LALEYRFYNGYNAINEAIPFTRQTDDKSTNPNGLWYLQVEAQSFFEAPGMIELDRGGASSTNFDRTICDKYGHLGVVLIDPKKNPLSWGRPLAATDKEAKKLGDEIHATYLNNVVQEYINRHDENKAAGKTSLPAQGYVKYALNKLGIADPARNVQNFVEKAAETSAVAELKAQVDALIAQLGGNKAKVADAR